MMPITGDLFGPYEILGTLGRGGAGEVYRAWDGRLEREVALKVLHEDYPLPGNRERFLIEARAASALSHPNICTVFDMGEKGGLPYLVMELLKGITLRQRIERGPMGAEEIVSVAIRIAAALGAAHDLGIIHRDIKPANVILTRQADGRTRVKVLDFGLAKLTEPLPGRLTHINEHLTVVGEAVGTVSYMSPEQARGDELDGRSDLFSLGVVMYEMATRRTPFQGATTPLLFAQLLGGEPEPIREWNEEIPRRLEKVILKLMEKEPARRFQHAAEVIRELDKVASKLTSGVASGLAGRGWRKAAPAVSLVRVEEPVARPELPARPAFLPELPRGPRSGSGNFTGILPGAEPEPSRGSAGNLSRGSAYDSPGAGSGSRARGGLSGAADRAFFGLDPTRWRGRAWLLGGVAAAAICAAGAMFTVRAAGSHAPVLGPADSLMITAVENQTGVQTLDGSIAEGLQFDLAQNETLPVRTAGEFRTVVHVLGADGQPPSRVLARQAAEAAGARAFVYGEVREGEPGAHSAGIGFSLHVAVLETSSSRELASADARAARTEEIPGAIDQVAGKLMRELKGGSDQGGARQIPLAREATGSLNALHAYAVADRALAEGRRAAALHSFALATAADPGFVQAQLESAWLAHEAGAEVASAQAALRAMDAAQDRSARTVLLAEVAGELLGRNDADRASVAAKTLLDQNPHDLAARLASVRTFRASGQYEKALRCAQQALAAGARDPELFREAELSLVGMDRYGDALELEQRSARDSLPHPEIALGAAYLAGKEDGVGEAIAAMDKDVEDAAFLAPARAAYLDNTGQLADGQAVWAEASRSVRSQPALAGLAELLLARGGLNRALTGECSAGLEFAHASDRPTAGPEARADASLAAALCHDSELASGGNPDLATRAALALAAGDAESAVAALSAGDSADGSDPLLAYVRGMAHLQSGRPAEAIQDFQGLVAGRGSLLSGGTDLYPAAQLKLARAFAEAGEQERSMEAYRQFLALWDGAGSADRLRSEAVAGARGAILRPEPQQPSPAVAVIRAKPEPPSRTVEVAAVRQPRAQRSSSRAKEPYPTPAWLMPSEPEKAAATHSEAASPAQARKTEPQAAPGELE